MTDRNSYRLTPEEEQRRKRRSRALGLTLGILCLLLFAITIAKLGPQVLNRPL
ncbi:hypothetical protein MHY87_05360 [Microvirga sp. ACRRW]|uniref:hypothetical protein n=1 Tax=Microvirga sp. ACRRW TaxID=2918205 RepID=UPI001EF5DC1C|nr:hypothetical protein [Microvirga sp. ACRRW]MCG7392328.1 hypothetical protein [Microvirga sp. ACRRW]